MPFPPSKTTYVRPLRESDENANHRRTFTSPEYNKMQQFEGLESSNVIGLNGEVNLKNMDEVKKIYLENLNSIHSKLFAGVEEIQKWKTSVELESKQKNKKVEELLQTLEVQRKTILDLQLENENLSYQLSEEIQQRSFVIEKLNSTKELCSALKKHYATLQGHCEYRNKVEEGFNIADAKRLSTIDNLQNKFERVCRKHSEKVGYLNDALASETNKALNLKETLEQQIGIFKNEKESLCRIIENQQLEIQRISTEIDEEKSKSKLVIEEKNALKFKVHELDDLVAMHSSNLKEMEETLQIAQKEKLELEQKLLSEKTKIDNYQMEFTRRLEDAKFQEKESEENLSSLKGSVSLLEAKIHNIEAEIIEEKQRNEILMSTISVLEKEKDNLTSIIFEAKNELASYEQLKVEYKALEEQASEFSLKEKYFQDNVEKFNEELLQYKSERERDSEFYGEKEENLKKMIGDYKNKIVMAEEKIKSIEESNVDLLHKVNMLEKDLNTKADEVFARDEKILSLESAINTCQEQFESVRCENIILKEKIESDKVAVCLECEQLTDKLKQMESLNITLQKAEEALIREKAENLEIMKILNDTESSYNNDRMAKEKEIIKFQEQLRRLEDEMRIMNVKVEESNTIRSLNQKQKEEIEVLKSNATQQEEEFNELKSENEKLKENLENFKCLTGSVDSLNENKENTTRHEEDTNSVTTEDQNKLFEIKKNKTSKLSAERKRRKMKNKKKSQSKSFQKETVFSGLKKDTRQKKDAAKTLAKVKEDYETDSTSSEVSGFGKNITNIPEKKIKDEGVVLTLPDLSSRKINAHVSEKKIKNDGAVLTHPNSSSLKNEKSNLPYFEKNKWEVDSSGSEYLEIVYDQKNQTQSQSKSFQKESVFSGLKKDTRQKKDTAKTLPKLQEDYETDSTSSEVSGFGKNITNIPEKKIKDEKAVSTLPDLSSRKNNANVPEKKIKNDGAVLTHPNSSSLKNEKSNSTYLEKNKWEVDSSGSEYLELAYDQDSQKVMGLTPQRSQSSSALLNSSDAKKPSAFNPRMKRDIQSVNMDNSTKKFGLPLKKNKTELRNLTRLQPMWTPERNVDFWKAKEMRNTSAFNTPSTPADKRQIPSNTSTPSGQRKFFKTPLYDRDTKFKKPASQAAFSDFLKSSK